MGCPHGAAEAAEAAAPEAAKAATAASRRIARTPNALRGGAQGRTPEGLPGAAIVAYLSPHQACLPAYSSDRFHRAEPPHQSPRTAVRPLCLE
jgi:hypothetical protein